MNNQENNNQFSTKTNNQVQSTNKESIETLDVEILEKKLEKQTNETLVKKAKNKSKKTIIISLIIVLLLAVIGSLFYILNNPKSIFQNSVAAAFYTVESMVDGTDSQYIEGNGTYNLKLNDGINNYNFDVLADYSIDAKNGLLNYDIATNYDNLPLINFNLYNNKDGFYLYSADLYDKYVKLDNQSAYNSLTKEDTLVVIRAIKDATLVAIDGEKISGNNLTIKVNDQNVKTKRVSLTIDKNNVKTISDKFINSLTSNQNFLDIVSNYLLITPNELKEELEDLKSELDTYTGQTIISIYTKGFNKEFVRLELTKENNVFQLTKISDEEYDYNVTSEKNTINGTLTKNEDNNKTDMSLNFNMNGITGTLKMTDEYKEADNFKTIEVSNSVNAEAISEEDKNIIYAKLFSNEGFVKLLGNFMSTIDDKYWYSKDDFEGYVTE